MFSRRCDWQPSVNRLALARQQRQRSGLEILDLTASNPTTAGVPWPADELREAMARAAAAPYDPQPLGIASARETVAAHLDCDASDVMITASTSEAYSFLFKLLADPRDTILTAVPSYPLIEHLAGLELIELRPFPLEFHRRWELGEQAIARAMTPRTRAIVVVNPNNPTGSYVRAAEQDVVARAAIPVISDEVFFDYAIAEAPPAPSFVRHDILTFTLGGLSKSAGLPHYKLGWIRLSGPEADRRKALEALELIADNFLSVATPVQVALPDLLGIGSRLRASILERVRGNLAMLQHTLPAHIELLPVEGGWSAVLRVPRTSTDEQTALELLEAGVLVHPGYFFDFDRDGYLVLSLLTPADTFAAGVARIVETVAP